LRSHVNFIQPACFCIRLYTNRFKSQRIGIPLKINFVQRRFVILRTKVKHIYRLL
jgi:hypothetical protein